MEFWHESYSHKNDFESTFRKNRQYWRITHEYQLIIHHGANSIEKEQPYRNPFLSLWNILGTTGGIISLSSMVENWTNDLIQWKGFILSIITSYREIARPIFLFLFAWVPFHVPFWVHDYLVLGLIVAGSEFRAVKDNWGRNKVKIKLWPISFQVDEVARDFVVNLNFWPVLLITYLHRVYLHEKRRRRPTFVKHNPAILHGYRVTMLIAAVTLGFVVLLAVNAIL